MAGSYSAARTRILQAQEGRSKGWAKKALKRLDAEFGAEALHIGGAAVAVELASVRIVCKKRTFKTAELASDTLAQIHAPGQRVADKRPVRAYLCTRCEGWHLTSWASIDARD